MVSGEGSGTPLQSSCLEHPTDKGAWWAAVHGVSKSGTWLERLHFHFSLSRTGEGNGNALQFSCLENPRDGGAWWAAVYGVTQSWTRLKRLSSSSSVCRPAVPHLRRSLGNSLACADTQVPALLPQTERQDLHVHQWAKWVHAHSRVSGPPLACISPLEDGKSRTPPPLPDPGLITRSHLFWTDMQGDKQIEPLCIK